jgi:hypothetical protein
MGEWVGPVRRTFRNVMAGICGAIAVYILLIMTDGAIDVICCGAQTYIVVIIAGYYVYRFRLEIVLDHIYARYDMDKDIVCQRIDLAMRVRGVTPTIDFWGSWVVFPLPPMSIVVRQGWKRTTVFVGPLTPESRDKVKRLEAFVDAAMGERSRPY